MSRVASAPHWAGGVAGDLRVPCKVCGRSKYASPVISPITLSGERLG